MENERHFQSAFIDYIAKNIYEQLGILDEQSNKASYNKIKRILKLNSVDVKNISLKRYSYYMYELEIENGYIQELGEHEEEYVPEWGKGL